MNEQLIDNGFHDDKKKGFRYRNWFVFMLLLLCFVGLLFKIQHWPGSALLILVSSGSLAAYSLSVFVMRKQRNAFNLLILILSAVWLFYIVYGWIGKKGRPYNERGLLVYCIAFLITFLICEMVKRFRNR